ncbi:PD-(D/E)XK nuclease-like domain-containing protein [Marinobacterium litorale]|uniref:PD-(D/E)XK nuclease-like domain-containing protein n=1 Tax=Marinobacterium litorale TaxID=404770 RepID=UPI0003F8F7C3|nr:PD-(D/E)XK nuclease-like domain-containing protein [Marinobacterium litorale]
MNASVNPFDIEPATESAFLRPGFYPSLSNAEYHAGPGISKSGLDYIAHIPSAYKWAQEAPVDEEKLKAMDFGTALHCLLLEPHNFDSEFAVAPELNMRTNAGKEEMDEFKAANAGKIIMTHGEHRQLMIMRDSVFAHPTARWLFEQDGTNEGSIYWTDEETGELCRCRPDRMLKDRPIIIDVKKVDGMERFEKHVEEFRYHVQDAMYSDGFFHHFGEWPQFMFLAVSSSVSAGRYAVDVVDLPDDWKHVGAELYRRDLNTYHQCRQDDDWLHVRTLRRPRWAAYND